MSDKSTYSWMPTKKGKPYLPTEPQFRPKSQLTQTINTAMGYDDDDYYRDEDVGDDGTIVYDENIQKSPPASTYRPSGELHNKGIQERHGDEVDEGLRSQWSISAVGFVSEEKSTAAFEEAVIAQRLFKQLGAKNSRYGHHSSHLVEIAIVISNLLPNSIVSWPSKTSIASCGGLSFATMV